MKVHKSGWPSGLRRQTQGIPFLSIAGQLGNSGPLMRAWVRIPLLTKYLFNNQRRNSSNLRYQILFQRQLLAYK